MLKTLRLKMQTLHARIMSSTRDRFVTSSVSSPTHSDDSIPLVEARQLIDCTDDADMHRIFPEHLWSGDHLVFLRPKAAAS
jgi:hypothetical protein